MDIKIHETKSSNCDNWIFMNDKHVVGSVI